MKTTAVNVTDDFTLNTITAESGDRIIVDMPNGAMLTIGVDAGIILFHRSKDAREGSVAITAPLQKNDAATATAVAYEEQTVTVQPMADEDEDEDA